MPYNEKQQKIVDDVNTSVRKKTQAGQLEGHDAEYIQAIKAIIHAYEDEVDFSPDDVVEGLPSPLRFKAYDILKKLASDYSPKRQLNESGRKGKYFWMSDDD